MPLVAHVGHRLIEQPEPENNATRCWGSNFKSRLGHAIGTNGDVPNTSLPEDDNPNPVAVQSCNGVPYVARGRLTKQPLTPLVDGLR